MTRRRISLWLASGVVLGMAAMGHVQAEPSNQSSMIAKPIQPLRLEPFDAGNDHYRRGEYEQAAKAYQALLSMGVESGAVYYNFGNALLKQGRAGEAVWAYLKARAWIPRDPDLQANLAYAQTLLPLSRQHSLQIPAVVRGLTLYHQFTTRELADVVVWLMWGTALCWMLAGWIRRARPILAPAGWVSSALTAVLLTSFSAQSIWIDGIPRAVVVVHSAIVRFAPQDTGTTHFTLPEGTLVRVLDRQTGWVQIRRGDGRAGWVDEAAINPL